jgi:hypothetical protein
MRTLALIGLIALGCSEEHEDHRVPFIQPAAPEEHAEAPVVEAAPIDETVEAPRVVAEDRIAVQPRAAARPRIIDHEVELRPRAAREVAPVAGSGVTVTRAVAAREVVAREPSRAPIDASAERTFLFIEAANPGEATTLAVTFIEPNGVEGAPISLELPASERWRTWAATRRTHARPGAWVAVVRDAAGRELAREQFSVAAPVPDGA